VATGAEGSTGTGDLGPPRGFLTLEGTKWQCTHGVRNVDAISPDNWTIDQVLLDLHGNKDTQLAFC
jgi:hypothetical protein